MNLKNAIQDLKHEMQNAGIVQEHGLGTELFHFSSTLAPVANVDLLITDQAGRILLSWREDCYNGAGWHVPGSCIRFQETIEEAIQRCGRDEIGTEVIRSDEPIKVFELHREKNVKEIADQRECAHYISLVFACKLPIDYKLDNRNMHEGKPGHLVWFESPPDNIVELQKCYKKYWYELKHRIKNIWAEED